MKQFFSVFKFEFQTHVSSKSYIVITIIAMAVSIILSFMPTFFGNIGNALGGSEDMSDQPVLVKFDEMNFLTQEDKEKELNLLSSQLVDYTFKETDETADNIRRIIADGKNMHYAIIFDSKTEINFIVEKVSLDNSFVRTVEDILNTKAKMEVMSEYGISSEEAANLLYSDDYITSHVDVTSSDQTESFWYTYILLFALYMAIMMYGQLIAQNVASEKGTRAMEMLITSAKPTSLIFGKVIAGACAGFLQLLLIFGTAFYSYKFSDVSADGIIGKMIGIPFDVLLYALLFFVLGFFFYAFIYAALGSLANRIEDISMLITPITLIYVIAFIVAMLSMSSGNVDSTLMKVCTYIPFTSPMILFVRITMGNISNLTIVIGILVLIAFVLIIGVIASKIYKMGVTMYGNTPKFRNLLKLRKLKTKN